MQTAVYIKIQNQHLSASGIFARLYSSSMRFRALLFVLFSLLILSCRKDPPVYPDLSGQFRTSVKVDGVPQGSIRPSTASINTELNTLKIVASIGNNDHVEIYIKVPQPGTFQLGQNDGNYAFFATTQNNAPLNYVAVSGIVVIEEYTETQIKGTFNFVGRSMNGDEKSLTDGTFESEVEVDIDASAMRKMINYLKSTGSALKKRRSE